MDLALILVVTVGFALSPYHRIAFDSTAYLGCTDVGDDRSNKLLQGLEILLHSLLKILIVERRRRMIQGNEDHLSVGTLGLQNLAV